MSPALQPGCVVLGWRRRRLKVGQVVVARLGGREVVKRIDRVDASTGRYWLVGDNRLHSTDSREYGPVPKSAILGAVMIKFAQTTPAPKTKAPADAWLGVAAATLAGGLALVQLFRLDTWLPGLEFAWRLGVGTRWTYLLGLLVVAAEVFCIPFLLRMELSRAARMASGALVFVAPWFWLLLSVWLVGTERDSLQLGGFFGLPVTWFTLVANSVWLMLAVAALQRLGYQSLFRKPEK